MICKPLFYTNQKHIVQKIFYKSQNHIYKEQNNLKLD